MHHRIGGEQAEHRVGVDPDERGHAGGQRHGDEIGHPHAPRDRIELARAEQIPQHDLRRLRQRDGIQVGDARDHRAVHLHRDHRGAQHVDERQDDDLREVVVHLLARRGDAHAQHAPKRLPGERAQVRQAHAHIGMAQHEAACHREACDARHHVRYRRAFHPERRDERDAADEHGAGCDVHRVHRQAGAHHVGAARVAAQQSREREERPLHHRGGADDQQERRRHSRDGPVDVQPGEELRPKEEQHRGHGRRERYVHHEGHSGDLRHLAGRRRFPQHAGHEHGGSRAHGRQRDGHDVEDLQRVSHRGGRLGSQRRQHKLVDVTDHNLHEQFHEQRDGKHEHVAGCGFLRRRTQGAFATRRLRALRGSARFRRQARRLRGSCSIHGFPSSFRMNGRVGGRR